MFRKGIWIGIKMDWLVMFIKSFRWLNLKLGSVPNAVKKESPAYGFSATCIFKRYPSVKSFTSVRFLICSFPGIIKSAFVSSVTFFIIPSIICCTNVTFFPPVSFFLILNTKNTLCDKRVVFLLFHVLSLLFKLYFI